eukprot:scaffold40053_cov39-Tisochrysis_lutea.AAC.1
MSSDQPAVPILDLRPYTDGGNEPNARASAASQMDAACRSGSGFVAARLPMNGVDEQLVNKAFAAAKLLFDQPEEHKLKQMRRLTAETNCGYSPLSVEALDRARGPDRKEAFNIRKPGVHHNDYSGCPPGFKEAAETLWNALEAVATGTCECAADALGLGDTKFFSRTLSKWDQVTLRFLHYPPCDWAGGDPPVRCGAHTDFGLFTFLFVLGGEEGLQVKKIQGSTVSDADACTDAGWVPAKVPCDDLCCIINTGALTARWTNDNYQATAHRVVVPTEGAASRHRYSIAFFVDPDEDAMVSVLEWLLTDLLFALVDVVANSVHCGIGQLTRATCFMRTYWSHHGSGFQHGSALQASISCILRICTDAPILHRRWRLTQSCFCLARSPSTRQ